MRLDGCTVRVRDIATFKCTLTVNSLRAYESTLTLVVGASSDVEIPLIIEECLYDLPVNTPKSVGLNLADLSESEKKYFSLGEISHGEGVLSVIINNLVKVFLNS